MWAVTAHRTSLFLLPGQSVIEAQVQGYQKTILRSDDPLRDANENAKTLYDTLVSPAAAMIPKGSKVFIIPDGVLNGLNFETLLTPGKDNSHYWIEDVTVTNANSIRLLSGLDQNPPAGDEKKLLLIGNPIATGTGYENLMNAFAEIRGIEKHFPPDSQDRSHPVRGRTRGVCGKHAGAILIYPLCGSRHGKPIGSAGFGGGALASAPAPGELQTLRS